MGSNSNGDGPTTSRPERVAKAVDVLGKEFQASPFRDGHVHSITMRAGETEFDDILLVARMTDSEGKPCVGFHSAATMDALLVGFVNRVRNGTMKWHDDKFAVKE